MNPRKVAIEVRKGVAFVCATCEHYWAGKDRGMDYCVAQARGLNCAGPLKGKSFPHYKGAMTDLLNKVCFVCGSEPDGLVLTPDQGSLGVCEKHMELLESYSMEGEAPPFITRTHAHELRT